MGRSKTIDRDAVLDAAERLITEGGAQALTIGTVAAAAGITKGGVQSCFGTRETLLAAILDRWMAGERRIFAAAALEAPTPEQRIAAHVQVTRDHGDDEHRRAASLLGLLLHSPAHLTEVRRWYAERLDGSSTSRAASRNARLAFFAAEGAFFLRYFGLVPMTPEEWDTVLSDAAALATRKPTVTTDRL